MVASVLEEAPSVFGTNRRQCYAYRFYQSLFRAHLREPEGIEPTFASAFKTSLSASSLRKHYTSNPYILWLDKGRSPFRDSGLSGRVLGSCKEVISL